MMKDTNNSNEIIKILTELVVSDKELFLTFIRRLATTCEETEDMTTPAASVPQAELRIS